MNFFLPKILSAAQAQNTHLADSQWSPKAQLPSFSSSFQAMFLSPWVERFKELWKLLILSAVNCESLWPTISLLDLVYPLCSGGLCMLKHISVEAHLEKMENLKKKLLISHFRAFILNLGFRKPFLQACQASLYLLAFISTHSSPYAHFLEAMVTHEHQFICSFAKNRKKTSVQEIFYKLTSNTGKNFLNVCGKYRSQLNVISLFVRTQGVCVLFVPVRPDFEIPSLAVIYFVLSLT